MKKILFIVLLLYLASCSTTSTYFKNHEYDRAIHKLVLQLQNRPTCSKKIAQLKGAIENADSQNMELITSLKMSGMPDIWDEVYWGYDSLEKRQTTLQILPKEVLDAIEFNTVDYNEFMDEAREKSLCVLLR